MIAGAVPVARLSQALHALADPPAGPAWNIDEIADLLPDHGRQLRRAAVLVGLVPRPTGVQVLLTRRTESLRHHAGQISFPGGRIERIDPDPAAAALREAGEEIALDAVQAQPLGYLDPLATVTGFHVFPLVAAIAAEFQPRRDPSEVDEVFEVPLEFLLDATQVRHREVDFRGGRRKLVEFQFGQYRIWGATAAMLVNLRERLERTP
jgi:8-oxo-dGTP pyrophosphatase MutT (NUDIX family)